MEKKGPSSKEVQPAYPSLQQKRKAVHSAPQMNHFRQHVMWVGLVTMTRTCSQIMLNQRRMMHVHRTTFFRTPYSVSRHTCFRNSPQKSSIHHKITLHSHKIPDYSLPRHIITMIFHPSACSILLLLLHGGNPDPTRGKPADSTRHFLKHEAVDSPAPSSSSPITERPSLPIPINPIFFFI